MYSKHSFFSSIANAAPAPAPVPEPSAPAPPSAASLARRRRVRETNKQLQNSANAEIAQTLTEKGRTPEYVDRMTAAQPVSDTQEWSKASSRNPVHAIEEVIRRRRLPHPARHYATNVLGGAGLGAGALSLADLGLDQALGDYGPPPGQTAAAGAAYGGILGAGITAALRNKSGLLPFGVIPAAILARRAVNEEYPFER